MDQFTVKISGKQAGEDVSPAHAPLKEVKETLEALYALVTQTTTQAEPAAFSFRQGSLEVVISQLPIQTYTYLETVMQERRPAMDEPYMEFIRKLERTSRTSGFDFTVLKDDVPAAVITPLGADLQAREPRWVKTTLTISGQIMSVGGKRPNIHVVSDHDKEQHIISVDAKTAQSLQVYSRYVFDVFCEQVFGESDKIRNLRYRSHLPLIKKMTIEQLIESETPHWMDVENVDAWAAQIRGHSESN